MLAKRCGVYEPVAVFSTPVTCLLSYGKGIDLSEVAWRKPDRACVLVVPQLDGRRPAERLVSGLISNKCKAVPLGTLFSAI